MIQPDRNILTAAQLLTAIAGDVEKARRHLTLELRYQDGTPSSASGADSQGGRGERTTRVRIDDDNGDPLLDATGNIQYDQVPVTIVEQAAINRQHITNIRDDLNAHINGIVTMTNNLAQTCTQILGLRFETPRCTATGRDGAIEWGQPGCTNVPARGTLCIPCYHRERRWRILRGLPTREEPAA